MITIFKSDKSYKRLLPTNKAGMMEDGIKSSETLLESQQYCTEGLKGELQLGPYYAKRRHSLRQQM